MLDAVAAVIRKFEMIEPGDTVMVGVSGGADSLALLHILKRLGLLYRFNIVAAHLNHSLRGEDASADEAHVLKTCQEWGIFCVSKTTNVRELADKFKISVEEAGRKARYEFFLEVMSIFKADKLALAHHKDDRAETIMHNIIRGTGTHGLIGINYVRDSVIIRPLLDISKERIIQYCDEENILYKEDVTNLNFMYTRNKIRHKLLPFIRENFNPNITETLLRMSEIVGVEDDFLDQHCRELKAVIMKCTGSRIEILLSSFNVLHVAVKRRLLRMAIREVTGYYSLIELTHIDKIVNMLLNSKQGAVFKVHNKYFVKKGFGIAIVAAEEKRKTIEAFDYTINLPGSVFVKEANAIISAVYKEKTQIPLGKASAHIDADIIQNNMIVRNRRNGDRFKPFGMKGEKKLKEFFIDLKVPLEERDRVPLVMDGCKIVWVAGYQINEDYRVNEGTTRVIELRIDPVIDDLGEEQT